MNMPMKQDTWSLTEKEKETLRLIVRGHDAKSIARSLDLSVHTINERLRDARRKMAVSSSREAARLLLDVEGDAPVAAPPENLGDMTLGDVPGGPVEEQEAASANGAGRSNRRSLILIGAIVMTFTLGMLALATLGPFAATSAQGPVVATQAVADTEESRAARHFLELIDQERWADSYNATGTSFRKLNTLQVWTSASEQARGPLGAVISRNLLSQENLPAPPAGYEVVKFRTKFANQPETIETVSLDRENGRWVIVGVTIG